MKGSKTEALIAKWTREFKAKYPEGTTIPQKTVIVELAWLVGRLAGHLDARLSKVEAKLGISD